MKAFIFAAGRGMRLGEHAEGRPKVLLAPGGRTLLDRHLENLTLAGVRELVVVTGYQRELLLEELAHLQAKHPVAVQEYENREFTEGSVLSFGVALEAMENAGTDLLLMDGDVLYPAAMLRRLVNSSHPTALLVDLAYSKEDDDPVLVPIHAGRPMDFVKGWRGEADRVGESVGFFKVDRADVPLLVAETRARIENGRRQDSYDDVLRVLVQAGRFGHVDVTGMPWTEIDFGKDLERAENEVLPAVTAYKEGGKA